MPFDTDTEFPESNVEILIRDARKADNPCIVLAVAYLVRPDGTASPAHFLPEWGDGENTLEIEAFVMQATSYLEDGEQMYVRVKEFVPRQDA